MYWQQKFKVGILTWNIRLFILFTYLTSLGKSSGLISAQFVMASSSEGHLAAFMRCKIILGTSFQFVTFLLKKIKSNIKIWSERT